LLNPELSSAGVCIIEISRLENGSTQILIGVQESWTLCRLACFAVGANGEFSPPLEVLRTVAAVAARNIECMHDAALSIVW
jgi:hypothetical protein